MHAKKCVDDGLVMPFSPNDSVMAHTQAWSFIFDGLEGVGFRRSANGSASLFMVDRLLEVSLTAWKGEGRNECLIGIAAKRMKGSAEGLKKKKKSHRNPPNMFRQVQVQHMCNNKANQARR